MTTQAIVVKYKTPTGKEVTRLYLKNYVFILTYILQSNQDTCKSAYSFNCFFLIAYPVSRGKLIITGVELQNINDDKFRFYLETKREVDLHLIWVTTMCEVEKKNNMKIRITYMDAICHNIYQQETSLNFITQKLTYTHLLKIKDGSEITHLLECNLEHPTTKLKKVYRFVP